MGLGARSVQSHQNPHSNEAGRVQDRQAGEAHTQNRRLLRPLHRAAVRDHRLPLLRAALLPQLDGAVAEGSLSRRAAGQEVADAVSGDGVAGPRAPGPRPGLLGVHDQVPDGAHPRHLLRILVLDRENTPNLVKIFLGEYSASEMQKLKYRSMILLDYI